MRGACRKPAGTGRTDCIEDEFGEVGDMEYLKKRFHLTAEDIVKKAEKAIERKSKK